MSNDALQSRALVGFKRMYKTSLVFADLTGDGLKALGLNNDISAGGDYTGTQVWAAAIHAAMPDVDGIRYVSRQRNDSYCFAIFGRSAVEVDSWLALPRADMDSLCARFNVRRVV